MIRSFILLVIFSLSATLGFSQAIPEKANTIIITLPDSNGVKDKIEEAFTSKDYTMQKSKDPSKVYTNAKTLKGGNTRISLAAEIKGAEVILTGNIVAAGQGSMRIEYKGNKGTSSMNAWEEMDKVARALGKKVKYEVR